VPGAGAEKPSYTPKSAKTQGPLFERPTNWKALIRFDSRSLRITNFRRFRPFLAI
jgi:hypothetical protein